MVQKLKYLILVLALLGCGAQTDDGDVQGLGAGGGGIAPGTPVKWPTAAVSGAGLNLQLSQDFIDDFVAADLDGSNHNPMEQMAEQWNNASGAYNFLRVPMSAVANKDTGDLNSYFDGEFGIYRSYGWFPNVSSNALAITQFFGIRVNVGTSAEYLELTHADIMFNYRDFAFSTNASSGSDYDIHSVILHELGHFLGLPHQNNFAIPAVMQPFLSIFDSQRNLFNDDQTAIRNNYDTTFLSATQSAIAAFSSATSGPNPKEGEQVQGIIELRSNGKCHHYIDGELVEIH